MLPGLNTVLVAARANWGTLAPGNPEAPANRVIELLAEAATRR